MQVHVSVDFEINIDPTDAYYNFKSTDPDKVRTELQQRLAGFRRDLFEEITCAGSYKVNVT